MKNLNEFQELNALELAETNGGSDGFLLWAAEKMVDYLIDEYDNYVATDCYRQGCSIGMGTSGNTPFTGM